MYVSRHFILLLNIFLRYQILKDIGIALRYLHHECNKPILHRDIKPGNILLDFNFNAKIADFGLSRIIASKNNTTLVTTAIGTVGYMDPECIKNGDVELNRKSDVYSFGIILLEIACRKTRDQVLEHTRSSAEPWMVEAADEKLNGVFDKTQMERVIVLGLKCSDPQGKQRPYMLDAMKFLEDGIELPEIIEMQGEQSAPGTSSSDQNVLFTSSLPS
jgi:serine/threonine protein kinase